MARVKTTARAYRLACGCVIEFSSLPAVSGSVVLCGACGGRTTISFRYPDSSCASTTRIDKTGGGVTKVRCTLDKTHPGPHFDKSVSAVFRIPERKGSSKEGSSR